MAKLTAKARKAIPTKDFAVAGRKYPIEDKAHARNALARVAQHGSTAQKAAVKAKMAKKFPAIDQNYKRNHRGNFTSHNHSAVGDY